MHVVVATSQRRSSAWRSGSRCLRPSIRSLIVVRARNRIRFRLTSRRSIRNETPISVIYTYTQNTRLTPMPLAPSRRLMMRIVLQKVKQSNTRQALTCNCVNRWTFTASRITVFLWVWRQSRQILAPIFPNTLLRKLYMISMRPITWIDGACWTGCVASVLRGHWLYRLSMARSTLKSRWQ